MPPAFVLSQDQTLRKINYFIRKSDSKHLNCVVLTTSVSRCLKLNSQGYIALFNFQSAVTLSGDGHIRYHIFAALSSANLKYFLIFLSAFVSVSLRYCCECRNLIYHKILFCQAKFLIFFKFFISLPCSHELVMGRRTRHNISSDFILSNHFEQKIRFFCKKSCSTRKRVSRRVCAWWLRGYACRGGVAQ